jgi:hypothetical protein
MTADLPKQHAAMPVEVPQQLALLGLFFKTAFSSCSRFSEDGSAEEHG